MNDYCFALACEFVDDGEKMILVGNVERVKADNYPAAKSAYESKHRVQVGWDDKKLFRVIRIVED